MTQAPESFVVRGSLNGDPWEASWLRVRGMIVSENAADVKYEWVVSWRGHSQQLAGAPPWKDSAGLDWTSTLQPFVAENFDYNTERKRTLWLMLASDTFKNDIVQAVLQKHLSHWDIRGFPVDPAGVDEFIDPDTVFVSGEHPDVDVRVSLVLGPNGWKFVVSSDGKSASDLLNPERKDWRPRLDQMLLQVLDGGASRSQLSLFLQEAVSTFHHCQRSMLDESVRLRVKLAISDDTETENVAPAIVDLIKALSEYHIAGGGNGLMVTDLEIRENELASAQVLV